MSTTLPELFNQMNSLGLTFRRSTDGEIEVQGDTGRLTDAIRGGHRRAPAVVVLPAQSSPAVSPESGGLACNVGDTGSGCHPTATR